MRFYPNDLVTVTVKDSADLRTRELMTLHGPTFRYGREEKKHGKVLLYSVTTSWTGWVSNKHIIISIERIKT